MHKGGPQLLLEKKMADLVEVRKEGLQEKKDWEVAD